MSIYEELNEQIITEGKVNSSNIPTSFWHVLSLCIFISTVTVLYISVRSNNVSIEFANAKITLSSALSDVKIVKAQLEDKNNQLSKSISLLQNKLASIEAKVTNDPTNKISWGDIKKITTVAGKPFVWADTSKEVLSQEEFADIDAKIQSVEKSILKYRQVYK